jgi:hypothetical protein
MLNQPSLAILIDFWNPVGPKKRVDDTIEFLNTDVIKTVVLSTYNSRSELFAYNNSLWYRNRKEWYEKSNMDSDVISAFNDKQRQLLNKHYDNGFTRA